MAWNHSLPESRFGLLYTAIITQSNFSLQPSGCVCSCDAPRTTWDALLYRGDCRTEHFPFQSERRLGVFSESPPRCLLMAVPVGGDTAGEVRRGGHPPARPALSKHTATTHAVRLVFAWLSETPKPFLADSIFYLTAPACLTYWVVLCNPGN